MARFIGRRAVWLLAILCAAIGPTAPGAWAETPAKVLPIKIGMQTAPDWPLVTARQLHLFQKVGLRPTFLVFAAGAPMMAAAESGSVDVSVPGTVPFTAGLAQGVPWVAIGIDVYGPGGEGIVVRKGEGIHTIADLKGKRIGFFRASTSQYGLFTALKENGLDPSQVSLLAMSPVEQVAAMRHKDIDAAEVWEPWMLKMVHQADGRILATENQFGVTTTGGVFAVRRDWLKTHQETAKRFMQAIIMAYNIDMKNPDVAVKVFARETGIKVAWSKIIYKQSPPPDPYKWLDATYPASMLPDGPLAHGLTKLAKFLYQEHITSHLADPAAALDDSVIKGALDQAESPHAAKLN